MAKAKYGYRYSQTDFGTERHLTVYVIATGQEIGTRDPFWNAPMYIRASTRKRHMVKVAREIIADYEAAR